jgi:hypothetical protein
VLSPRSRDRAIVLRMLLNDGELAKPDPVELQPGTVLPFEAAARIVLTDVDHLTTLNGLGRGVSPDRWRRLSAELETLYDLAVGVSSS